MLLHKFFNRLFGALYLLGNALENELIIIAANHAHGKRFGGKQIAIAIEDAPSAL